MITEEEQDELFDDIRRRIVTVFALSTLLYEDIVAELQVALFEGFGGGLNDFDNNPQKKLLINKLNRDIHRFAAAKDFQQTKDMSNFILNDRGLIRSFSDFKVDAKKVFDRYNEVWLQTEFNTMVAQSQAAANWVNAQNNKESAPLIRYQTAHDEKVRPQHADWDGITRAVDDPFWNSHYPPNGFNCRCTTIELSTGKITSLAGVSTLPKDDIFAMNFGKDENIFKNGGKGLHPYFQVPGRLESLKKNNFGLPLP